MLEKKTYNKKTYTTLLILSFIFIILNNLILEIVPSADGYELSIYTSLPIVFWIFLILSSSIGIFCLFNLSVEEDSNYWYLSLVIIILVNFVFIILSAIRGYSIIGGASADIFSHIGWIKDIENNGQISENNFYPLTHILFYFLNTLTKISLVDLTKYIPAFFWSAHTIFILFLSRQLTKNRLQQTAIILFSSPLIYSVFYQTIHPSFLSFTFIPLILAIFLKRNSSDEKKRLSIILLTLCIFIVFFHPETTIILIIILSFLIITAFLFPFLIALFQRKIDIKNSIEAIPTTNAITLLLILVMSFLVWYSSSGTGLHALESLYTSLFYGSEWSISTEYSSNVQTAQPTIFQTLWLALIRFGPLLFYSLLSGILFFGSFIRMIKIKFMNKLEFFLGMQLIGGAITASAMIVGNFIVINPIRVSRYLVLSCIFYLGVSSILFINYFDTNPRRLLKIIKRFLETKYVANAIYLFILMITIICFFNVYPSPISYQPNNQYTHMDHELSMWFVDARHITIATARDPGTNIYRIEHYTKGVEMGEKINSISDMKNIPNNFGYSVQNTTLINVFNSTPTYILSTKNGWEAYKAFPKNIQSKATQYNSKSFEMIMNDYSVNLLYNNRESLCFLTVRA